MTLPLAPAVVEAMHARGRRDGHRRGLPRLRARQGYDFLRRGDPRARLPRARRRGRGRRDLRLRRQQAGLRATSRRSSATDCSIAVTDPVYPVYVDTNVMAGRAARPTRTGRYAGIVYLPRARRTASRRSRRDERADVVYLLLAEQPDRQRCSTRAQLERWVAWARAQRRGARLRRRLRRLHHRSRRCRARSTRSPARASARSRCAASASARASRACAAPTPWCRRSSRARPRRASACRCASSGRAASRPSSTACPTSCSARPRPSTRPRAASRPTSRSPSTCENARRLREGLGAAGLRVFGGVHAPYLWLAHRRAGSRRGSSSTAARARPTSSARRAPASAPPARATSASPPSTRARTSRRRSPASAACSGA